MKKLIIFQINQIKIMKINMKQLNKYYKKIQFLKQMKDNKFNKIQNK